MVPEHHTESVGLDATSPPAPGAQFCRRDGATMPIAQSFAPETCLVNPSNVHQCADSIGMCLRGAVTIPASTTGADAGVEVCAVAQCVVLDLSYRHRNSGSDALLQPVMPLIRGVGASGSTVAIVTCELEFLLDPDNRMDFMLQLASHPDEGPRDTLSIAAMRADAASGEAPLWYRILETSPVDDLPDLSITADSGKFYLEQLQSPHL